VITKPTTRLDFSNPQVRLTILYALELWHPATPASLGPTTSPDPDLLYFLWAEVPSRGCAGLGTVIEVATLLEAEMRAPESVSGRDLLHGLITQAQTIQSERRQVLKRRSEAMHRQAIAGVRRCSGSNAYHTSTQQ
jgi:hypothetical protein